MISSNPVTIDSDGSSLSIAIAVKNDWPAKLLAVVLNVIVLGALVVSLLESMPFLFLVALVVEFRLAVYSCWNFFGKETIKISKGVMTYQHEYGLFKTPAVVAQTNERISCVTVSVLREKNRTFQYLQLESCDKDEVCYILHRITPKVTEADAKLIREQIEQFYVNNPAEEQDSELIYLL
jgi:hypothetical protein